MEVRQRVAALRGPARLDVIVSAPLKTQLLVPEVASDEWLVSLFGDTHLAREGLRAVAVSQSETYGSQ